LSTSCAKKVRDVETGTRAARSFFGSGPELKGRDVLVVDAVLESGVTQEFLPAALAKASALDTAGGAAG